MAASHPVQQKPIHSLIVDTGPLIKNTVSISTIINSAEELYTTPAILSEIRDEATRSRVQTTLVPFLKIRTPSAASYDAVSTFSRKTGDYTVLSKQDLGILALAYEIHCERNGGDWGLREAPKQPIKRRPSEETEKVKTEEKGTKEQQPEKSMRKPRHKKVAATEAAAEETMELPATEEEEKEQTAKKQRKPRKPKQKNATATESATGEKVERPAVEEGWEQPRGKRAIKSKYIKPAKEEFWQETVVEKGSVQMGDEQSPPNDRKEDQGGIALTQEQVPEQEIPVGVTESQKYDVSDQHQNSSVIPAAQESTQDEAKVPAPEQPPTEPEHNVESSQEPLEPRSAPTEEISTQSEPIDDTTEQSAPQQETPESTIAPANLEEDMADLTLATPPQDSQHITYDQLTPPATSSEFDSDSDSDGSWITPSNLSSHQAKESGIQTHAHTTKATQIDVATMTIDFAMQNVLLQMNLHLLSTNMQRIKHLSTKVLRCHACFAIVKQLDKQFCPRCGQATLRRVSCSTNAKGEFRIHLSKNYQWNTRGDKYSIPKPIAGTANGKWSGQGGGKGGWGRDLVLAEDQKEFQRGMEEEKRRRTKDLMDEDYLPGILTGERSGSGGKTMVGAGRNVNSRKKF